MGEIRKKSWYNDKDVESCSWRIPLEGGCYCSRYQRRIDRARKNKNISEKIYKNLNPEGQRCEDDRSDVGVVSSQFQ